MWAASACVKSDCPGARAFLPAAVAWESVKTAKKN
jgi:hypothetical protein